MLSLNVVGRPGPPLEWWWDIDIINSLIKFNKLNKNFIEGPHSALDEPSSPCNGGGANHNSGWLIENLCVFYVAG